MSKIVKSKINKSWYALYVKSRHEKCVHSELQQKGIEPSLPVLPTTGVVKFVTFNNVTVSIPEDQMYRLQQMIDSDLLLSQEKDFPIGTEVGVMFGPLQGLRGRVKQKNSETRLVVWFNAIMQGVSVIIDPVYLELADNHKIASGRWQLAASSQ